MAINLAHILHPGRNIKIVGMDGGKIEHFWTKDMLENPKKYNQDSLANLDYSKINDHNACLWWKDGSKTVDDFFKNKEVGVFNCNEESYYVEEGVMDYKPILKSRPKQEKKKKKNFDQNSYEGVSCQQADGFKKVFAPFLERIEPERIIEIGTGSGGFTMFLQDSLDRFGSFARIWSYDINCPKSYERIEDRGVSLVQGNIFKGNGIELLQSLINADGTTLVLCDGGNKKKEFNTLSKFLKVGDLIMAHDYIDTKDNFLKNYKNKIWNWREIGDEDIAEACEENNLKEYDKKIFDTIVWTCRVRV